MTPKSKAIPDLEGFNRIRGEGNLIPVYKEILADIETPVSAFLKLRESPSFLLESVEGGEKWARFSFLGISPRKVIRSRGRSIEVTGPGGTEVHETTDPVGFLRSLMSGYRPVGHPGLPGFYGGLVGYLGYDMVRFIEDLPDPGNNDDLDMEDMFFMLTDTMLIFDNLRQKIQVVRNVHLDGSTDPEEAYAGAVAEIDGIIARLKHPIGNPGAVATPGGEGEYVSTFASQAEFEDAVLRAKEYVRAGDVIQVVLSQRFRKELGARPFDVYRALRVINPSPYMYYLDTGAAAIVGSSPEILVRLEGDDITLRPIAGTRGRGANEAEDLALAEDLKADPKEVAEHIMLVDLGRNDVGRVARTGTVRVTELMEIERYSHVMHMVSNVKGVLDEGLDSFDVLSASFPAGTVTGAPKIRAMQIIDELETAKRGPYAGAVGYFSYTGDMDTCITIRTLIIKDGVVHVQAGAGIVADSVPATEFQETLNKARAMFKAVDMASEIGGQA